MLHVSDRDDLGEVSELKNDSLQLVPANSESRAAAPTISASAQVNNKKPSEGLLVTPLRKPVRVRNKSHLNFAAHPRRKLCWMRAHVDLLHRNNQTSEISMEHCKRVWIGELIRSNRRSVELFLPVLLQ